MNNFFTIIDQKISGDLFEFQVRIHPAHEVFQGHFPEKAIVPGVFQLEMVKDIMQTVLNKSLRAHQSKEIKFLQMWLPEDDLEANILIEIRDRSEKTLSFIAQIRSGEKIFMKYKGEFLA